MISTLIRSKQGTPLPLVEGKSEYLVDTESNTIIYPKTRIEDIIGLSSTGPGNGCDMIVKSYGQQTIPISGGKARADNVFELSTGIWLLVFMERVISKQITFQFAYRNIYVNGEDFAHLNTVIGGTNNQDCCVVCPIYKENSIISYEYINSQLQLYTILSGHAIKIANI